MPALSPTMKSGKITKWNFKEGDKVDAGDVLAEIETDKSSVGFEMQEEGYIAKILQSENSQVNVGTPVVIMVSKKADVSKFADYSGEAEKSQPAQKSESKKEPAQEAKPQSKPSTGQSDAKPAQKPKANSNYPKHEMLKMPSLSPTMKDGKILKWNVKVGDQVTAGDAIAEIQTDKSAVGFEVQDDGYIAQILAKEGEESVKVGKPVVVIVKKKGDVAAFQNFTGEESGSEQTQESQATEEAPAKPSTGPSAATKPKTKPKPKTASPTKSKQPAGKTYQPKGGEEYPKHDLLKMPSLSPTMKDGKILKWNVSVGDKVQAGDAIAEIQTDKSAVGFEVQDDGYIAQILAKEGEENVEVGKPVVVIVKKKDQIAAFQNYELEVKEGETVEEAPEAEEEVEEEEEVQEETSERTSSRPQRESVQPSQRTKGERIIASPYAKRIVEEKGFNLSQIPGSGPNGRILASDVLNFVPKPKEKKKRVTQVQADEEADGSASYSDVQTNDQRKGRAKTLLENYQSVPHYHVTIEVNVDKINKLKKQLKEEYGESITVDDWVIKAAALACRVVPEANSQWRGDIIRQYEDVDIAFMVAAESGFNPVVITSADSRSITDLSAETNRLIEAAKGGSDSSSDTNGGTFTIANLGALGVQEFSNIVNPSHACTLNVGHIEMKPVFSARAPNNLEFINIMKVTLSNDHRVVDGAVAAKWLNAFRDLLENPMKMLV